MNGKWETHGNRWPISIVLPQTSIIRNLSNYFLTRTFKGCKKPFVLGNIRLFKTNKATGSKRKKSIIWRIF